MCKLDIRTRLYAIKDELDFSMIQFGEYIKEEFPLIACDNVKKNYIYLTSDMYDISQCLSIYIQNLILNNELLCESFNREDNIVNIVRDNIDIFVDIIDKDSNTVILEIA